MAPGSASSRLGRSTAFVGVLLVGALALTGLLAYQAFDANRSHAEAVHKTLGEQAQFAAWEYANTVRRTLDAKVLYLGLDVVAPSARVDGRDAREDDSRHRCRGDRAALRA